jgi:hypothetical protein
MGFVAYQGAYSLLHSITLWLGPMGVLTTVKISLMPVFVVTLEKGHTALRSSEKYYSPPTGTLNSSAKVEMKQEPVSTVEGHTKYGVAKLGPLLWPTLIAPRTSFVF